MTILTYVMRNAGHYDYLYMSHAQEHCATVLFMHAGVDKVRSGQRLPPPPGCPKRVNGGKLVSPVIIISSRECL